ncbi:PEGA domain-containing protein [Paraliomyxa miuraensis]|uniref:PEGA domain-containing protein n=1 Tax=Paraliomyxa miuraensis TaxID=376150 RepID=UPI0022592618|nr:PEGA domain-containing protein [Paraliomyxa miuraensis]MCX4242825.1 PEGA domain-containing protein [Paraliomyxa miuraensis]
MLTAILSATASIAAVLASPNLALAAEPRVGLLPLELDGKLPPNGDTQLAQKIESSVAATGAAVVPAATLGKAACPDEGCMSELAAKAGVTHLVRPSVRLQESDYVITLAVVDGITGQVIHEAQQVCELCGLTEAIEVAGSLAGSLKEHLVAPDAQTGTLSISSSPTGAEVLVDGQPVGVTPLQMALPIGSHQLTLRRGGFESIDSDVSIEAGLTATIELALTPVSAERKPLPPIVRPLSWAAIGVGTAALGSGIALFVLDERPVTFTRCSGDDVDAEGNCRFRHKTLAGGVIMTVTGVVAITAGALLLVRSNKDRARDDDRRVRLRPGARGIALHF